MADLNPEKLFLEALCAAIHGRRLRWGPIPPADWDALFRLAGTQKLLPMLVDALCDCANAGTDPRFPAYRIAAKQQVLQQTRKDSAFFPIYARLRAAGLDALVVKGCLCRAVYPNGALRISADEDLLVPEEQFPAACSLLAEAGLRPLSEEDPGRAAEIGWRTPDGLVYLELHKYLFAPDSGPFGLLQKVFSAVFSAVRAYPMPDGGELLSLSPHDHLLYLLLHAMKHFIRTGFGLRQICDVGLWASRWQDEIDWSLLRRQAEQVHGAAFSAALFRIAEEQLTIPLALPAFWRDGAPDPTPMLRDLLEGGIYGSSTRSREHSARITQDAVAAQRAGKRRSLRSAIFPSAKSLEGDYPLLKEHPAALPLVWQARLLRYLKHAGAAAGDLPTETLRLGKQRLSLLREYGILDPDDRSKSNEF